MKTGIEYITEERQGHQTREGWTPEHDDTHVNGELANAAACYARSPDLRDYGGWEAPKIWPWHLGWWKPGFFTGIDGRIRELAKAGALVAAEIDRLERLKQKQINDHLNPKP